MKDVKKFVINLYNNDSSFSYSPQNKISNLYSTCFGVMCLDLINGVNDLKNKENIAKYILKFQDKKSGYFIDSSTIPKKNALHNQDYVYLQLTDFAQLALSALNQKPMYKYKFLAKYKNEKYLEKWFYNLNWGDPWYASNLIMFILNSLIYENELGNKKYVDRIMNLLSKSQNQKNGYWNLNNRVTYHNQMAGAYHFIFFYTYLEIQPNLIKKIICSTLAIQNYDGLFNYAGRGGSCDDLDAIDLLCRSTFYTDYKKDTIMKKLKKTHDSLLCNQNSDGGFCWANKNSLNINDFIRIINFNLLIKASLLDFFQNSLFKLKKIITILPGKKSCWAYSGLESMKIEQEQSDLFSTWFRLTSIAIIEETFPEITKNKKSFNWNLRKKCGLGFYKK